MDFYYSTLNGPDKERYRRKLLPLLGTVRKALILILTISAKSHGQMIRLYGLLWSILAFILTW